MLGEDKVQAVLDDYRSADLDPKLEAMLGFVDKLTRDPDAVTGADIAALREAGISDEAIEDAALVCAGFSTITRIADAFEFAIPERGFDASARNLLERGYLM